MRQPFRAFRTDPSARGTATPAAGLYAPARTAFGDYRFQQASDPGPLLSGDLIDCIPSSDGVATVCFGDASGHGFRAAMTSSLTRTVLRECDAEGGPTGLIRRANTLLTRLRTRPRFVSLWVGSFGPNGQISFVDAGHGHWFILDAEGHLRAVSAIGNIPIGIDAQTEYATEQVTLERGDRLVLFSDGIVEQCNRSDEEFGLLRLLRAVRGAATDAAEAVIRATRQHSECASLRDDASIAIIERV